MAKSASVKKETNASVAKPAVTPRKEPEMKKREVKAVEKKAKKTKGDKDVDNMMKKSVGKLTIAEVKKLLTMIEKGE